MSGAESDGLLTPEEERELPPELRRNIPRSSIRFANGGHDTRAIQAYLGHRSIMSTVRYTALTPNRFKHFWKD
jgi:hypothetical protein